VHPAWAQSNAKFHPIDALDKTYSKPFWNNIIGKKIIDFNIIRSKPRNIRYEGLPNEVRLLLIMENGNRFLFSNGLHNNMGDFAVITEDQILPEVLPQLVGLQDLKDN
jgi:hypothetical protein